MIAVTATGIFGALGVAALATVVPALWRWTQLFSTFVHESGHAFVALLTGRVVTAVEIFRNGGGCTTSYGQPGPLLVPLFAAGYSAPPLVGLALVAALVQGISTSTLLLVVLLPVVIILVLSRNLGAVLVVGTVIAALAILIHRAGPISQTIAVLIAAWFLLLAGLRNNVELMWVINRGRGDDASKLAENTGLAAEVWVGAFIAVAALCIYQGGRWLLG